MRFSSVVPVQFPERIANTWSHKWKRSHGKENDAKLEHEFGKHFGTLCDFTPQTETCAAKNEDKTKESDTKQERIYKRICLVDGSTWWNVLSLILADKRASKAAMWSSVLAKYFWRAWYVTRLFLGTSNRGNAIPIDSVQLGKEKKVVYYMMKVGVAQSITFNLHTTSRLLSSHCCTHQKQMLFHIFSAFAGVPWDSTKKNTDHFFHSRQPALLTECALNAQGLWHKRFPVQQHPPHMFRFVSSKPPPKANNLCPHKGQLGENRICICTYAPVWSRHSACVSASDGLSGNHLPVCSPRKSYSLWVKPPSH